MNIYIKFYYVYIIIKMSKKNAFKLINYIFIEIETANKNNINEI